MFFVSQIIDWNKWGSLNAKKADYQHAYGQSTC